MVNLMYCDKRRIAGIVVFSLWAEITGFILAGRYAALYFNHPFREFLVQLSTPDERKTA